MLQFGRYRSNAAAAECRWLLEQKILLLSSTSSSSSSLSQKSSSNCNRCPTNLTEIWMNSWGGLRRQFQWISTILTIQIHATAGLVIGQMRELFVNHFVSYSSLQLHWRQIGQRGNFCRNAIICLCKVHDWKYHLCHYQCHHRNWLIER